MCLIYPHQLHLIEGQTVRELTTSFLTGKGKSQTKARLMTLGPKNLRLYYSYFWQKEDQIQFKPWERTRVPRVNKRSSSTVEASIIRDIA